MTEETQPTSQIPGFLTELVKQLCGILARHLMQWVGGLLIGLGLLSPETLAGLVDANAAAVAGGIFTLIGLAWAGINSKRLLGLVTTALHLRPRKTTGQPTTIADVRDVAKGKGDPTTDQLPPINSRNNW